MSTSEPGHEHEPVAADPEVAPSAAEILTKLRELDRQWSALAAQIGRVHGGRDLLLAADSALQELEATAAQAGLVLADALAGRAPHAAALLREWLANQLPASEPAPQPKPEPEPEPVPEPEPHPAPGPEAEPPADELPAAPLAPPSKPLPPPVAVTDATALELQARLNGHDAVPLRLPDSRKQHHALEKLRKVLGGVPPALGRRDAIMSVLKQVELTVAETATWPALSETGRRILLEAIAARVRAIQDAVAKVPDMRADDDVNGRTATVMRSLRKLTAAASLDRAAWGLAVRHEPHHGTWLDDARISQAELEQELGLSKEPPPFNADDAFRRLREDMASLTPGQLRERLAHMLENKVPDTDKRFVGLLAARLPDLADDPKLRRLLRRVADALEEADRDDDTAAVVIDPNWPGFVHTRGRRAVIVGGDGREERAPLICEAFQLASLEWPDVPKGSPGKAASLIDQVRGKRYDIVICLQRFISHSLTDQLFGLDVPGVRVVLAKGYGVQQIRLALDRYLPRVG